MISFINLNNQQPYVKFKYFYDLAKKNLEKNIEAINISSYDVNKKEVNSRYVNLKYIDNEDWIFFSNYKSPKAVEFENHNKIASVFYWKTINVQIRIKAIISKVSYEYSDLHFSKRDLKKNALAISSHQSELIDSYESVKNNYEKILNIIDPEVKRPSFWGGFSFRPYYFEFWEGDESRINKRNVYSIEDGMWKEFIIQP